MCSDTTKTPSWVSRMLSEATGTPSTRRTVFVIVVVYVLGLVTAALWLQRVLSPEAVDLLKSMLYSTGIALGVGKFAEGQKMGGQE